MIRQSFDRFGDPIFQLYCCVLLVLIGTQVSTGLCETPETANLTHSACANGANCTSTPTNATSLNETRTSLAADRSAALTAQTQLTTDIAPSTLEMMYEDYTTISGNSTKIRKPVYKLKKEIVDKFFNKYEKSIRPHPPSGEDPTTVAVNLYIRSISSINELSMQFTIDLLVRQIWNDPRLKYSVPAEANVSIAFIKLSFDASQQLWKPDLFFPFERQGSRHTITTPNVMLRIYANGTVLYGERYTLVMSCQMNLVKYPFDTQECQIQLGSFSDTTESLVYTWVEHSPILVNPEVRLPKFSVGEVKTIPCSNVHPTGNFSCLKAQIQFTRQLGFYLVESYLPTTLLVIASWLGFWIDASSVPGRVCLSVTTLLTTVAQTTNIKNSLPPVSYVKAIDIWCCICIFYVFMALAEFAFANYLDYLERRQNNEKFAAFLHKSSYNGHPKQYLNNFDSTVRVKPGPLSNGHGPDHQIDTSLKVDKQAMELATPPMLKRKHSDSGFDDQGADAADPKQDSHNKFIPAPSYNLPRFKADKAKQIDRISRVVFPLTFMLVCMIYVYVFLNAA